MTAAVWYLTEQREAWDVCGWPQLRPGSSLLKASPPGRDSCVEPAEPCPAMGLPVGVEALSDWIFGKTLRGLRAHRRQVAMLGDLRWEIVGYETRGPIVETLLRWKGSAQRAPPPHRAARASAGPPPRAARRPLG